MTKFWYQLNSFVPQNFWICWSNNHFFCQTQMTSSFATFVSESTFKSEGRSITMDTNLTETDFLDVSFNLKRWTNFLLIGTWTSPLSTSILSQTINLLSPSNCHLWPADIFQICHAVKMNSTRLNLFTNQLWKTGGLITVWNSKQLLKTQKRNSNRKAIWLNPPYSLNIKTNTDKVFLKLVRKHFHRSQKFNKIFNINSINISYSWISNGKNLIKQHNSKILSKDQDKTHRSCNCRIKESCPLNGKCLHQCMV